MLSYNLPFLCHFSFLFYPKSSRLYHSKMLFSTKYEQKKILLCWKKLHNRKKATGSESELKETSCASQPTLYATLVFVTKEKNNAGDGTWTHTILRPQAPEACASANSATPAFLMFQSLSRDCLIIIQHIQSNVNTNFQKNLKNYEPFMIMS